MASTSSTINGNGVHSTSSTATTINNKRKLQDAIQSLDDAVNSRADPDRSNPPKRQHTMRSFYSTLAKFSVNKAKQPQPPSSNGDCPVVDPTMAPQLAKLLARSRAAQSNPSKLPSLFTSTTSNPSTATILPASNPNVEYRPSSITSFLTRLGTFKLSTYSNKPQVIDAVAASKCGWINEGKDRLVCGICGVGWVVAGREGMNRDAANTLVEKQRIQLVEMHKEGCPWRTRQCDPDIYRIPVSSPAAMARDIKLKAIALEAVLHGVEVKHPLTTNQVKAFKKTLSSVQLSQLPPAFASNPNGPDAHIHGDSTTSQPQSTHSSHQSNDPSLSALLTALFGWSLAPPPPPPPPSHSRTTSFSRAPSLPASRSRASSVSRSIPSTPTPVRKPYTSLFKTPKNGDETKDADDSSSPEPNANRSQPSSPGFVPPPSPTPSVPSLSRVNSKLSIGTPRRAESPARSVFGSNARDRDGSSSSTSTSPLLQCTLCHRRIGLWSIGSSGRIEGNSRASTPSPSFMSVSASAPPGITMPSTPGPSSGSMGPPMSTAAGTMGPRQLDLLKEHRPYCPYVVKSTVVPSLPLPVPPTPTATQNGDKAGEGRSSTTLSLPGAGGAGTAAGAVEGWKAVLMIVSRYRMEARRREGLIRAVDRKLGVHGVNGVNGNGNGAGDGEERTGEPMDVDADEMEESMEDDPVEAMMRGVKSRGGKDLLRYVKGLLG